MKKCSDLENLLPLYAEGALSEEEKRTVEDHLAGCETCRRELVCLQKADELIKRLSPVEEPPWFEQKIMARVREEAEKKSVARRWFYPLRIKIPLQVMATLVIAVLAVYIYRTGDEQVKPVLPGALPPAGEVMQEGPTAPADEKTAVTIPVPREKTAVPEKVKPDKTVAKISAFSKNVQEPAARESKAAAAYEADTHPVKGLKEDREGAYGTLPSGQNRLPAAEEQMKDQERKAQDQVLSAPAKKKESYQMAAPAAPRALGAAAETQRPAAKSVAGMPEARVLIRSNDLATALPEAQKILVRNHAKNVTRQQVDGGVILRAEVPAANWKEILAGLKAIGQVEEKLPPSDTSGVLRVMIEISGK